ncbi:hypothetical protein [Methanocella sp. MCL-LM]|uniref:hypothetical protein n=1 Tax=Methanocella sp. MCL-LM TaxID=3412035 RepID=UPI003C76E045
MSKITLEDLQERVEKLSKKNPLDFRSEDCHEANNIQYACLGIVEDCDRPCPDRIKAAEIAVQAIELKASAIMEHARKLEQLNIEEQYDPVTVRCRGRIVEHAA